MDLRTAHPDQPWLWRADWAAGEIHSSPKAKTIFLALLAILWNFCAISALAGFRTNVDPDRAKISAWLMPLLLIGIGILLIAMRAVLRWRVYGESTFQLKLVPGTIGGALEGVIRCSHPLPPMRTVKLHLSCINDVRGADGKIAALPIWSDQLEVTSDGTGAIPVAIYIPPGCRPTATEPFDNRVTWKLIASATANPVSYRAKFEVPIFATDETSAKASDVDELRAQRDARINAFQPPEKSRMRVGLASDGSTEIFFPAFRNPAVALAVLGFLILWIILTILLFKEHAPLIFRIAWPSMDVLVGFWVLSLLFGSTSAHARNGEITIVSRVLGVPIRNRHLVLSQIDEIRSGPGMYAGNTVYRRIQIHCASKNTVNFGDGIADSIEADWIASTIAKAVGLSGNPGARREIEQQR
jgi:hypothetical protein